MAALAALALGGCLTDQVVERPPGRGIAEVSASDPGAAQANIESLTDVIRRNPSSPEAYNTRGSAYARLGHFQEAVDDFTQAIRIDPNNFTAYTNRALAYRQSSRNDLAKSISTAPSRPIPIMRRPISAAPICCARRAIWIRRGPISTPPSASIPRTPRRSTRAGSSTRSKATIFAP